jgi:hypothetical protein
VSVSVGLGAALLVVGFPALLLGLVWFLGWLESWMLMPDERAATVRRLLEQSQGADEVEAAVVRLLAAVADEPARRDRDRLQRTAS